jgi:endonuclease/exonuclease/phosphatase (EEP) superfamily protein YafD
MASKIWFHNRRSLGKHLLWLGLWGVGLGLGATHLLRWLSGDRYLPAQLLSYFMPWQLLALLPGLLLAGLARRYRLFVLLTLPALVTIFIYAPLFLPSPAPALAANQSLKVMSFNVFGLNQDYEAVAELILTEQPDILLLQEAYHHNGIPLIATLQTYYSSAPFYVIHNQRMGQAIISRYPLQQLERPTYLKGRTLKVRVDTPTGPIMIWNTHTFPPLPQTRHEQQLANLALDIAATDGPLIVGGDFNTTDQSEAYQWIAQHLANAHWQAGWSFGFSFPAKVRELHGWLPIRPLIRIDHIFYSSHFLAGEARTLSDSAGSDHFPVVAKLSRRQ